MLDLLKDTQAEYTVIGALLRDNNGIDKCLDLKPDMFADSQNQLIYKTINKMIIENQGVDVITLNARLKQDGIICPLQHLVDMHENTPSAANIRRYVNIVIDCHARRTLQAISQQIAELATSDKGDSVSTLQAKAMQHLAKMVDNVSLNSETVTAPEAIELLLKEMKLLSEIKEGDLLGLPTGLPKLDGITKGFRRGELVVIGGRPSMGKSCLAEAIMRANAKAGYGVRMQSYEMPAKDIIARSASAEKSIHYSNIKRNELIEHDYIALDDFINETINYNLLIGVETADVDKVCAMATAQKRKSGLDILIIDHLHLMPIANKNPVTELGEISGKLKRLAVSLDIVVVLVAQLNRGSTQRTEPTMADLRASGAIEQDADMVILTHRPSYYDENENPTLANLIIAKYRNGERQTVVCGWQGEYQRFVDNEGAWTKPKQYRDDLYI